MTTAVEDYLEDYNQISTAKMNLVMFMDALCHLTRISRIIRQPLGNALLLGMGGSGRQSLTRLATHMLVRNIVFHENSELTFIEIFRFTQFYH